MDKLFNSVLNHRECTLNQYISINLFFFCSLKEEQGFSLSCGPREIASILAGKAWQQEQEQSDHISSHRCVKHHVEGDKRL